jgi:hypothetical protein
MYEENKAQFDEFRVLSEKYAQDKKGLQPEYNRLGEPIVKIIHDWESRLCLTMEKGNNGNYSARLAEKFWEEVRTHFPLIDFVGVVRS